MRVQVSGKACEGKIPGRSARSRYAEPGALHQELLFDAIAPAGRSWGPRSAPEMLRTESNKGSMQLGRAANTISSRAPSSYFSWEVGVINQRSGLRALGRRWSLHNPSLERTGDDAQKARDGRQMRSRKSQRSSGGNPMTGARDNVDGESRKTM